MIKAYINDGKLIVTSGKKSTEYPVGAGAVSRGVEEGQFQHRSAGLLPILFATAGPAFIVEIVGKSFWGSTELGWIFYLCQIFSSALIYGAFTLFPSRKKPRFYANGDNVILPPSDLSGGFERLYRSFTSAVGNSAVTVIRICGFIVFFRVICDLFSSLFHDPLMYAVLASFLEFTSGTTAAATLGGDMGIFLCGTAIGFSGLSVIAQCGEILGHSSVSIKFLFWGRLISAPICGGLSLFVYNLFEIPTAVFAYVPTIYYVPSVISLILISFFISTYGLITIKAKTKTPNP